VHILTFHVKQPTGAEICRGLFPFKHPYHPVSFQLRNKLAVFSFCSAQNLPLKWNISLLALLIIILDENITAIKGTQTLF
jgi:hypothetical protein